MATPIPSNRAAFTLEEIVEATRGSLIDRRREAMREVVGLFTDSRAIVAGSAFVALEGETHDGHAFLDKALENRAHLLIVERGRAPETDRAAVLEVDDTLVAWGDLALAHLTKWRARSVDPSVVAITGSAGKTTTKELTAALLAVCAPTHFTAGNLNNRIGVPAVVFALTEVHTFAVLEMGMSLPGELDAITSFAKPDVSIVTNVGVAHAEGVGGREGVMHEKGALFRALDHEGVAIINADDEFVVRAAAATKVRRKETFGRSEKAHYRLVSREPKGIGSRVVLSCAGRTLELDVPFAGEVVVLDLCAAIAAQEAASRQLLSSDQIARALTKVDLAGRSKVRRLENDLLLLDDTYNANPASMRAALATLGEIGKGRRLVAVLGEMKELGELTKEEHIALGDSIAEANVKLAIGVGGAMEQAIDRAGERGVETVRFASDAAGAVELVCPEIRPGDAILVKGSRSVGTEKVVAAIVAEWPEVLPISGKSASSGAS